MNEPVLNQQTRPGWIGAVLLLLVPGGVYAGIVLSVLVLSTVLANEAFRRNPRMVAVGTLSLVTTVGALLVSLTLGS